MAEQYVVLIYKKAADDQNTWIRVDDRNEVPPDVAAAVVTELANDVGAVLTDYDEDALYIYKQFEKDQAIDNVHLYKMNSIPETNDFKYMIGRMDDLFIGQELANNAPSDPLTYRLGTDELFPEQIIITASNNILALFFAEYPHLGPQAGGKRRKRTYRKKRPAKRHTPTRKHKKQGARHKKTRRNR